MLRYLAVLAVMLACFTGDVSAVTDQEFQDLQRLVEKQADIISHLLSALNIDERSFNSDENQMTDLLQNTTIEERVTLLELQMTDVQGEVTDLDGDVSVLFENDSILFNEQVIQDERLLGLEQTTDQINGHLVEVDDEVESLQDTTLALDFRVTVLEENGGSNGELEERVETLEGTTADHEIRIASNEEDVTDLEDSSADHETRLTAAEENIQGLQVTDINHGARITALEANGGGGGETIAFHVVLTDYDTIAVETVVQFNVVVMNEGNGYDSTTGVFTVPSGGDGWYYFSTYLVVDYGDYGLFDIQLNDVVICSAQGDHNQSGTGDGAQATCSAIVTVAEGDEVKVVLRGNNDNEPLAESTEHYYNGFNGYRI